MRERLGDDTTLIVMSDHGFAPFRRGVNLNTWFRDNGYLFLKDDPEGQPATIPVEEGVPTTAPIVAVTLCFARIGLMCFAVCSTPGREERSALAAPAASLYRFNIPNAGVSRLRLGRRGWQVESVNAKLTG